MLLGLGEKSLKTTAKTAAKAELARGSEIMKGL